MARKATATRIAEASLTAGAGGSLGRLDPRAIERAMGEAAEKALADGIIDPAEILQLKLAARERVKQGHRAAVEREAAAQAKADKAAARAAR